MLACSGRYIFARRAHKLVSFSAAHTDSAISRQNIERHRAGIPGPWRKTIRPRSRSKLFRAKATQKRLRLAPANSPLSAFDLVSDGSGIRAPAAEIMPEKRGEPESIR